MSGAESRYRTTETANKDGTWLREVSSCCCVTTAGKTRQLLLNKHLHSLFAISVHERARAKMDNFEKRAK